MPVVILSFGGPEMTSSLVALTASTDRVRADELAMVAAALQIQVTRDFAPEWNVGAVVVAVPFESIPAGAVPLIVPDDPSSTGGFHRTYRDDSPYITVPYGPCWALAASHELLRMLANPSGSARQPGPSPLTGQATVEYLQDVCAPCQDVGAAYAIHGVPVADFATRAFFGAQGRRFSFRDGLDAPFCPAANGLVTWLADDGLMYQARADYQGRIGIHGAFSPADRGACLIREFVDGLTPDRLMMLSDASKTQRLADAEQNARRVRFTNWWRFQEDIAQRAAPSRQGGGSNIYALSTARSGQHRTNGEVAITARTMS